MTELSIVIPARNEAQNIGALLDGIVTACEGAGVTAFEVMWSCRRPIALMTSRGPAV